MSIGNGQMEFGYPVAPIGKVAASIERPQSPEVGATYRQIGVRLWGEGAYEREPIDGGDTKYKSLNRVESGDIIVNKIWARNGSVSVVNDSLSGCCCSGEFPLFRPYEDRLDPRWFYWMTRCGWFWHRCDIQSRGTSGKNRIRPEKFLAIEIPLPPLPEQRRMVAKIERLAAKIDEARGLAKRCCLEVDAMLHVASRTAFESLNVNCIVPLEDACTEIIDCLHSNPVYSDTGIPTVRSPDVGWGKLLLHSARRTSQREYERRTSRGEPREGDIILVREGGGTGKAAIVESGQKVSLGQRVMQLRPDTSKILPRFLLFQWLSPLMQEDQIAARIKGSASPHLNIGSLRKFDFILPPFAEQRRIVAYLDGLQAKADQVKQLQAESAAELDALLPAILDRAFKGQL